MPQEWNNPELPWQDTDLPWKSLDMPWNNPVLPWKQWGATVLLSGTTIAEDASVGDLVGTLSVSISTGNWANPITYTLTDDAGGKYAIDGDDLEVAAALSDGTDSITVEADNGTDAPITRTFSIVVSDVDTTAPTITSTNTISQAENAVLNHTLTANETVTWTKTGGADQALFTLAGSNLSLPAQDYESPADSGTNNTYVVQVTATDGAGNATNQTITVTITDVSEGGGTAGQPIGLLLALTKAA